MKILNRIINIAIVIFHSIHYLLSFYSNIDVNNQKKLAKLCSPLNIHLYSSIVFFGGVFLFLII